MELASVSRQADPGVVLDYEQISGTAPQNPYVFRQDTTYFVSGTFFVQDAVLEGGTVIKLNSSGQISISGSVDCQTGPYKMALFSSVNDDSIGDTIPSSSGLPSPSDVYECLNNWLGPICHA